MTSRAPQSSASSCSCSNRTPSSCRDTAAQDEGCRGGREEGVGSTAAGSGFPAGLAGQLVHRGEHARCQPGRRGPRRRHVRAARTGPHRRAPRTLIARRGPEHRRLVRTGRSHQRHRARIRRRPVREQS